MKEYEHTALFQKAPLIRNTLRNSEMVASSKTTRKKSEETINVDKDKGNNSDLDFDKSNVYIWPEWQESDITAEKWNTKTAFEDPDTQMYSHILGANNIAGWKRAHEFITDGSPPCVCNPGSNNSYLQKETSKRFKRIQTLNIY